MATLDVIANAAARPTGVDGDMYFQADLQQIILYDGTAGAWKVYTPDTGPYAIDGSNVLSVTPGFHFDATMVDGSSTAAGDNPVDTQTFDGTVDSNNPTGGVWTSRTNSVSTIVQGTGSKQPTYHTSGVNSKPYFAATVDYLEVSPYNKETYLASGPFTIFGVCDQTAGSYNVHLGGQSESNKSVWFNLTNDEDLLYYGATGADRNAGGPVMASGSGNTGTAAAELDVLRMFLVIRDSSDNTKVYYDGNNSTGDLTGTYTGEISWPALMGGGGGDVFATTGDYYECAFFNSDLSTADRNKLITYVNTKYGIGRNADDTDDLARAAFS